MYTIHTKHTEIVDFVNKDCALAIHNSRNITLFSPYNNLVLSSKHDDIAKTICISPMNIVMGMRFEHHIKRKLWGGSDIGHKMGHEHVVQTTLFPSKLRFFPGMPPC